MAKRILVVDDEMAIRRIVQVNLQREGYEVSMAQDGQEALEQLVLSADKPDLILTDVMMPYMDGFELLARIKADETLKEIPVVMITARAQDADILEGKDRGAASYITKPIMLPELLSTVRIYLGDAAGE